MALVSLQNISIAFGGHSILQDLQLHIEKGQRISLLGRNGSGKSTLMKIIDGQFAPDSGTIHKEPNLKISYFSQNIPHDVSGSVFEIIAKGLGIRGELLVSYHREEQRLSQGRDVDHRIFSELQEELDKFEGDKFRVIYILEALTGLKDKRALPYISSFLNSPDEDLKNLAVKAFDAIEPKWREIVEEDRREKSLTEIFKLKI